MGWGDKPADRAQKEKWDQGASGKGIAKRAIKEKEEKVSWSKGKATGKK